jgi:hypothetical protein
LLHVLKFLWRSTINLVLTAATWRALQGAELAGKLALIRLFPWKNFSKLNDRSGLATPYRFETQLTTSGHFSAYFSGS